MKNDIKDFLKHTVNENAVGAMESCEKVLAAKTAVRLQEIYKEVAKNTFNAPKAPKDTETE